MNQLDHGPTWSSPGDAKHRYDAMAVWSYWAQKTCGTAMRILTVLLLPLAARSTEITFNCPNEFVFAAERHAATIRASARFALGSAERPAYRAFHQDFPGVDDPETFSEAFKARRAAWNAQYPYNKDNLPVAELSPGLNDVETLLRKEKRPRAVIQTFLKRVETLRGQGHPYRDTHRLFSDVATFFSYRHPARYETTGEDALMQYADFVLDKPTVDAFQTRLQSLSGSDFGEAGSQWLNLDRRLTEFRRDLLGALDANEKSSAGAQRIAEFRMIEKGRKDRLAQAEAELAAILARRAQGNQNSLLRESDRKRERPLRALLAAEASKPEPAYLRFDGPNRRQQFYSMIENNRWSESQPRDLPLMAEYHAVSSTTPSLAKAGASSFRGLSEALLYEISPALLIRRADYIDNLAMNASAALGHDAFHLVHSTEFAKQVIRLPVVEKRRILNGIDSIGDSERRELAEYGLFLMLHETRPHNWAANAKQMGRPPLTDDQLEWLIQWTNQLNAHVKSQLGLHDNQLW